MGPAQTQRSKIVEDLENRFSYHKPTGQSEIERFQELRDECFSLSLVIEEVCPDSREREIAFARLEEVMMHSIASIARNKK